MLALFRRRVYDAAATVKNARITLDGEPIHVDGLPGLAQLYLGKELGRGDFVFENISDRWKVGVCLSPSDIFQSVSFVNGVATTRGGTHVAHVANPLLSSLATTFTRLMKLPAGEELSPAKIRHHIMLFVDAKVDNPEFDSQAKEALTSPASKYGETCSLSEKFVKKVASISGLREAIGDAVDRRNLKQLAKRTAKSAGGNMLNVPKLEDAELAGGKHASECTLILTEGDSAKALAVAGLEIVGRQRFGVFPLRGKPLNVRETSTKKIGENEELMGLMRALGLSPYASYSDQVAVLKSAAPHAHAVKEKRTVRAAKQTNRSKANQMSGLRYGRVMIMADQDADGSHVKGLVISMIHHFWPELLRANFVQEFHTPLLKAKRLSDGQVAAFFSMADYEAWLADMSSVEARRWRAKYYKGLGTSTAQEAREYFRQLDEHRVQLEWQSAADDDAIDMAFSKKRAADRRRWMLEATSKRVHAESQGKGNEEAGARELTEKSNVKSRKSAAARTRLATRSYETFVNEELVDFSLSDLRRSLPSAVDGLKPSQRKVLFSCFSKGLLPSAPEMKVAQLAGYCSERTAYHHGEASLHATITHLAQNFVGANNVPLLEPCGQFGTRATGGDDAASARYIFTRLSPITPLLYPPADGPILDYLIEDGQQVEPRHYIPVLPTILLNGSTGIGTGWSTQCWGYHPMQVLENVYSYADGASMSTMIPWIAGFRGDIVLHAPRSRARDAMLMDGDERATETELRHMSMGGGFRKPLSFWLPHSLTRLLCIDR